MKNQIYDQLQRRFEKTTLSTKYFHKELGMLVRIAQKKAEANPRKLTRGIRYDFTGIKLEVDIATIGGIMETTVAVLQEVNKEVEQSKKVLQTLANEIRSTNDLIKPQISDTVRSIRDSRMTITTEINKSLQAMRDVRAFFLEDDYEEQISRLERFIEVGERLKALIGDGTMEAICDVILKLAVEKEDKHGKTA